MSANAASFGALTRLQEYRDVVSELVPALSPEIISTWTINDSDAFMVWLILDGLNEDVDVLDVGTFVGASAFHYAGHPRVKTVLSVDPNPTLAEEINDKKWVVGAVVPTAVDSHVIDIARAALERSPQIAPIDLREGVVGAQSALIGDGGATSANPVVTIPMNGRPLIAHIDGLHTRRAVHDDLAAVFAVDRTVAAVVDDCRYRWGLPIQAGIADFLEKTPALGFEMVADFAPTASALGVVYRTESQIRTIIADLSSVFTTRWDALRLLTREADLMSEVAMTREELGKTREELLAAQRAFRSTRFRVADKVARTLLAVPGAESLRARRAARRGD